MVRYDGKAIERDVNIKEVLEYYGLYAYRGRLKCPSISHEDKNPSASIYKNKCKCFSCGKSFGPIGIVMDRDGLSFPEACSFLINEFGLDSADYCEEDDRYNNKIKLEDKFPFTFKELQLVGLDMGQKQIDLYDDNGNRYDTIKDAPTLKTLYKEEPAWFFEMVQGKMEDAAFRLMKMKMFCNDSLIRDTKEVVAKYASLQKCAQILRQYKTTSFYEKDNEDMIMDLLFLESGANNAKKCEQDANMLKHMIRQIPSTFRNESLVEFVEHVSDINIFIPDLEQEEEYERE